jgi:hypothetical protein
MGLIDDIKNQVKKQGANKGKFLYLKPGVKVRVRFLQDMEEGIKVLFHDSYALGVNVPCQEIYNRECKHHDNEDLRHRDMYMWTVWDHDAKEERILLAAVNQCSPIPSLVSMYETYGTLLDRDYVLTKVGSGQGSSVSVVPMDKAKFKNKEAKPFSESKMLKLLDKAYPDSDGDEEEEEDEEDDKKSKKHGNKKPDSKGKKDVEEEEDDEEVDYSEMSAKELYKLCKERDIEVEAKKAEKYYIKKLEKWDAENADSEDEEDDDEEW